MSTLLCAYANGNYTVELYDDGTKIKRTEAEVMLADFPDSIDLKITDRCDMLCPMCHERSTPQGRHGNTDLPFLKTLPRGMEVAIGGGNPLSHPALVPFLRQLKAQGQIANLTVNERHFLKRQDFLQNLLDEKLVYGLGISLCDFADETIDFAQKHENCVLHLIAGVTLQKNIRKLENRALKLLILGYKNFGRGKTFFTSAVRLRIADMREYLRLYADRFRVVSFDNLALEQMETEKSVGEEVFRRHYMGRDGEASMYVDLPNGQYAVSSVSEERFPLSDNLQTMFQKIRKAGG